MNPDSKRTNLEPSKEFVKELETKEVLGAPTPVQPSPFQSSESQNPAPSATPSEPVKPLEPVLDTVSHHTSRPLEAPVESNEEEMKREKAFKTASMLIIIFSVLTFAWGVWNSFIEINSIIRMSELEAFVKQSAPLQTYVPAALGVIGALASIGMFFKKSVARIVYLAVAFGYICLAVYGLYFMFTVLDASITAFIDPGFISTEIVRTIILYLFVGIVSWVFLLNKTIRAAFWR